MGRNWYEPDIGLSEVGLVLGGLGGGLAGLGLEQAQAVLTPELPDIPEIEAPPEQRGPTAVTRRKRARSSADFTSLGTILTSPQGAPIGVLMPQLFQTGANKTVLG